MQYVKKIVRLLGLACLLFLAGLGIGIGGAVPLPFTSRKKGMENPEKTELVEAPQSKRKASDYFLE